MSDLKSLLMDVGFRRCHDKTLIMGRLAKYNPDSFDSTRITWFGNIGNALYYTWGACTHEHIIECLIESRANPMLKCCAGEAEYSFLGLNTARVLSRATTERPEQILDTILREHGKKPFIKGRRACIETIRALSDITTTGCYSGDVSSRLVTKLLNGIKLSNIQIFKLSRKTTGCVRDTIQKYLIWEPRTHHGTSHEIQELVRLMLLIRQVSTTDINYLILLPIELMFEIFSCM